MTNRTRPGRGLLVIVVAGLAVATIAATVLVVAQPFALAQATAGATASPTATATATPAGEPSPSASDLTSPEPSPSGSASPDLSRTPLPVGWAYSDLDGVAAPGNLAHRLPMAIMIDDNTVARPQSGISSASIVYQAFADGGEDRYMYVFQEGTATDIGPVRSARPYYVYWANEYKPMYGHFGGDANTLQNIIPANSRYIYNMDDLNGGSCPYHRIATRPGPHNAYTNTAALVGCIAAKGYPATFQNVPTRLFRDDTPLAQLPASQVVTVPYRTSVIGYQFDPTSDSYVRIMDGSPEVDPANNQQVYARTVVVLYQTVTTDPLSEPGHVRPWVNSIGSGQATIFMEGRAISATWKKASTTALTRFYDSDGNEIPFVRGEIFMQSVPPGTAVTVS